MAVALVGTNSISGVGVTTLNVPIAVGAAADDAIIIMFAVEGQAASSGPWIDGSASGPGTGILGTGSGYTKIVQQAPSASGVALEIWSARWGGGAGPVIANFQGSYNVLAATIFYRGENTAQIVRAATSQQWTGDNPQAPTFYAFANEMLVAVAAEIVNAPGYSPPTGFLERFDVDRSGSFNNVSLTIADKLISVEGYSGVLPFTAATTSSPKGATAVFAIPPAASVTSTTNPLIAVTYP